jgi:aryl-alcohol dehydrogenase-like predicted oxidoreductase
LLKGYATYEGTARLAKRTKSSDDFFKEADGLLFSSISLGGFAPEAYKEENYVYSFKDSFLESIKQGCNHFDSALSYRYTKTTQELAEALKEAFEKGLLQRDEVIISEKAGFIPLDYPFPKNPYRWMQEELVDKGICAKEDVVSDQYCIAPGFIEYSCDRSREILGVETLDIFYIQNPEFMLGFLDKKEVKKRLEKAFKKCEELVKKGKIKRYGVATWNSFMYEKDNLEYLGLKELLEMATKVGGKEHSFKYILFPYNLAKVQAATMKTQKGKNGDVSIFEAASELGVFMIGVSPFLRMNLFKAPFGENFRALCGAVAMSDIQRALQFARSNGFTVTTVFSSTKKEHVEHNFELKDVPKISNANYAKIFSM